VSGHWQRFRERLMSSLAARRLADWWPDMYTSLLAILGAASVLANTDGAERVAIGRLMPGAIGDVYLCCILFAALTLIVGVARHRAVIASRCASTLGILLALNGGCVVLAFGGGAVMAACTYLMVALLLINRSYVLARGVVVPRWRAEADVLAARHHLP
jgi:hypothetical protein